jgi:hypothetical protein
MIVLRRPTGQPVDISAGSTFRRRRRRDVLRSSRLVLKTPVLAGHIGMGCSRAAVWRRASSSYSRGSGTRRMVTRSSREFSLALQIGSLPTFPSIWSSLARR